MRTCYLLVEWQAISVYGVWLHLRKPIFILRWPDNSSSSIWDLYYSTQHKVLFHRLSLYWYFHLLFWVKKFNAIASIRFLFSRIGIKICLFQTRFLKNLLYVYFQYTLIRSDLLCKLERSVSPWVYLCVRNLSPCNSFSRTIFFYLLTETNIGISPACHTNALFLFSAPPNNPKVDYE